jgi:hypothetical protein
VEAREPEPAAPCRRCGKAAARARRGRRRDDGDARAPGPPAQTRRAGLFGPVAGAVRGAVLPHPSHVTTRGASRPPQRGKGARARTAKAAHARLRTPSPVRHTRASARPRACRRCACSGRADSRREAARDAEGPRVGAVSETTPAPRGPRETRRASAVVWSRARWTRIRRARNRTDASPPLQRPRPIPSHPPAHPPASALAPRPSPAARRPGARPCATRPLGQLQVETPARPGRRGILRQPR